MTTRAASLALVGLCLTVAGFSSGCSKPSAPPLDPQAATQPPQGGDSTAASAAGQPPQSAGAAGAPPSGQPPSGQ